MAEVLGKGWTDVREGSSWVIPDIPDWRMVSGFVSGGSEGLQRKQGQDQDSEGVICFASTLCNIWRHLGYHNIKSVLTESFIPNTLTYAM